MPLASSCPAKRGRGHAKHGGRGFGINAGTSFQTNLLAARPLHRASARSPSPAARGRMSVSILAAHPCARVMPATTRKKKTEGGGAPKGACHPLSALSQTSVRSMRHSSAARTRANGARSPSGASPRTRHASRNQHWLSPRPCFLGPGSGGCHPPSPVPVQRAPRRPVVLPDQRCPGPPGSGTQIRARAPHPAPLPGLPRESDPRMSGTFPPNTNGDDKSMKKRRASLQCSSAACGAVYPPHARSVNFRHS